MGKSNREAIRVHAAALYASSHLKAKKTAKNMMKEITSSDLEFSEIKFVCDELQVSSVKIDNKLDGILTISIK